MLLCQQCQQWVSHSQLHINPQQLHHQQLPVQQCQQLVAPCLPYLSQVKLLATHKATSSSSRLVHGMLRSSW